MGKFLIVMQFLELMTKIKKDKGIKKIDEYLRYNSWNEKVSMKLDVGMMTESELAKILTVIKKDPVANSNSLNTIELYKKAKANPKNCVPRTLEHFATILKEYIGSVPKYRIFKQGEDGDWDAYVAVSIGYCPPRRTRDDGTIPAYVFLKAAYYHKGDIKYTSWNFHTNEVKGCECAEIIDSAGLITGSPELDAQFEKELARYKELRGAVGRQMWGSGMCRSAGDSWYSSSYSLDVDGRKARLVIDDHIEGTDKKRNESTEGEVPLLDGAFWKDKGISKDDDDEPRTPETDAALVLEVPLRPVVLVFNLEKHEQAWAHVNRLEDYVYDKKLGDKLVLPDYQRELIEILVQRDRAEMQDIIKGKAGGSIVLCSGVPGTGKTLTAEVFAETIERPLYVVASSQLGTDADTLETELKLVLDRASRFNAIMLIDEADVFIHERGESMVQNAVVGVFLRILEYFQGVLFFTTNRTTVIDDAIVSRCTAQVKFGIPTTEGQKKIWDILAELSGIKLVEKDLVKFVKNHPRLSGRDVKGLLKLANMIAVKRKTPIDMEMLEYVLRFKPTNESIEAACSNK